MRGTRGALEPTADARDLYDAVVEGAVERVRPKMMTVTAIMAGLLPILWGNGTGASVMKRIAAPMVGGMISSTVLTLLVIPAVYSLWRERGLARAASRPPRMSFHRQAQPQPLLQFGESPGDAIASLHGAAGR